MVNRIRQGICLIIALILIPTAAPAGTIDDLIVLLTRPREQATGIEMQAEALHIPELGETRLEWLNRLLRHITFRLSADRDTQEELILVDGEPAVGCVSRTGTDGTSWQFSFDTGTAYSTPDGTDLLSALSGITPDYSGTEYYSEMAVLMSGFYRFFEGLPAAFPEYSTPGKTNTVYKPYGTAVKKWSVSLPDDVLQSEKMIAYLDGEGLEAVKEYLSRAVLSGRQRFTLLTDADDRLMKVNYTAKAGLSQDDMRSINLDWRCLRGETGYRDALTLTTPGTGSRRDNLTITQEMIIDPEKGETYKGSIETDRVADRVRTQILLTFELNASGGMVAGNFLEKTTVGSARTSTEVTIDLGQNAQDEYRGSLEIINKLGKIEKEHYRIQLTAGKSEPPQWVDASVKTLTPEDRKRIAEGAANAFLRALVTVPEEDLQYILADLAEGLWTQMILKTDKSEETEQP